MSIDKEVYKAIKSPLDCGGYYDSKCYDAIWNGVPLPEGHGDLIDRDELEPDTEWDNYYDGFTSYSEMQIRNANTIIEAERSEI